VEVSPAYDTSAESTALAAAQIGFEILSSIIKRGISEKTKIQEGQNSKTIKDEL
jgi:agmatinase